jgi:hypothetical protein
MDQLALGMPHIRNLNDDDGKVLKLL